MGFLSRILGVDFDEPAERVAPSTASADRHPVGSLEARIEAVLESVRPALHADGGDIELVSVDGNSARVRLKGACDGCPSAALTLRFVIEMKLKEAIPEFEDLIPI